MAILSPIQKKDQPKVNANSRDILQHRYRIDRLCNNISPNEHRDLFNNLSFKKSRYFGLHNLLIKEINVLNNYDMISLLWH